MRRKGTSLVEFALVLPILTITMLGIVQFGLILFVRAAVDNAAREGARYGTVHPDDISGIQDRVRQLVAGVDPASLQIDVIFPDNGSSLPTNRIRVAVSYPLITFWPGPPSATYGTAATMRIEKQ